MESSEELNVKLNIERHTLDMMVAEAIRNGTNPSDHLGILKQSEIVDLLISKLISGQKQF